MAYLLPSGLLDGLARGRFKRTHGSWALKREMDAYGNRLESELGVVFDLPGTERMTVELPSRFVADGCYGESLPELAGPAAIPDILDFSGVVFFAMSGCGAPFCLDYRENRERPAVIWWDDVYWRRVAPDFDEFVALFDIP